VTSTPIRRERNARTLPARDRGARADPTHPRWTHGPLGGVLLVAVFDVVSVAGGTRPWARELYRAGTFGLMVTSALLVVALTTGLVDRARGGVEGGERDRVNLHAVLMSLMAGAAVVDLAVRRLVHADAHRTPAIVLAITLLALLVSVAGGNLGGRLTYRLGVGVRPPRQHDGG
jgi:uncharacterized membrane protein